MLIYYSPSIEFFVSQFPHKMLPLCETTIRIVSEETEEEEYEDEEVVEEEVFEEEIIEEEYV